MKQLETELGTINKKQKCNKNCKCKSVGENPYKNITAIHSEVTSGIVRRIEKCVKDYPNDLELGLMIRNMFN